MYNNELLIVGIFWNIWFFLVEKVSLSFKLSDEPCWSQNQPKNLLDYTIEQTGHTFQTTSNNFRIGKFGFWVIWSRLASNGLSSLQNITSMVCSITFPIVISWLHFIQNPFQCQAQISTWLSIRIPFLEQIKIISYHDVIVQTE